MEHMINKTNKEMLLPWLVTGFVNVFPLLLVYILNVCGTKIKLGIRWYLPLYQWMPIYTYHVITWDLASYNMFNRVTRHHAWMQLKWCRLYPWSLLGASSWSLRSEATSSGSDSFYLLYGPMPLKSISAYAYLWLSHPLCLITTESCHASTPAWS